MTQVMPDRAKDVSEATGAVLGQLMGDFAATAGLVLTALGRRLGLWDAAAAGPAPTAFTAGLAVRATRAATPTMNIQRRPAGQAPPG